MNQESQAFPSDGNPITENPPAMLASNDLEDNASATGRCYLRNRRQVDLRRHP